MVVLWEKLASTLHNPRVGKLRRTVLAREQRLAAEHLGENAADGPDVDGLGVLLEGQHDFGSTIPASGNVFRHEARVVLLRRCRAGQTKIANLEIAVGIQQEVGGLQVAMEHVGRVHRFQSAQRLVDEVLAVVIRKILCADDAVHIRLHEFLSKMSDMQQLISDSTSAYLDQIDLVEALVAPWLLDVEDGDDVLVVEVPEQLHLTQCSQAEHRVVEGRDLFDGNLLARWLVDCRAEGGQLEYGTQPCENLPDNAIGTFSDDILNIVLLADIEGNLAGPAPVRCVAHPVPGGKACWRGC